jgi:hypothetical protein
MTREPPHTRQSMLIEMEPHLAIAREFSPTGYVAMAKNQDAHKSGGGIGGKTKRDKSAAKRAQRVSNLAQRADDNRTRQKGNHQAPKAKG